MPVRFKIVRQAMNMDRAYVCGLVVKLGYDFPKKEQPHLEIFPDNDLARSEEWDVYGAKCDSEGNSHESVRRVEFSRPDEWCDFELVSRFRIRYVRLSTVEIDYPRGGRSIEPEYHFEIEKLP